MTVIVGMIRQETNVASFAKTKEKAAPFGTAFYFLDD
jgi:hypothetical protein